MEMFGLDINNRVKDFFSYLLSIKKINKNIIRDIKLHDKFIWESEILECSGCVINKSNEQKEEWLEVKKQKLVEPPKIPEDLEKFIEEEYSDPSRIPQLKKECLENGKNILENDESLKQKWEQWINEWYSWSEEILPSFNTQALYDELFKIYIKLQKNGEGLELIWGHGFLSWEYNKDNIINYPIFTTRLELTFDAKKGKFSLRQVSDTKLELYMLEGLNIPNMEKILEIKKNVKETSINPRNIDNIEEILKKLVALMDPEEGNDFQVHNELFSGDNIVPSTIPAFYNASVIILRKNDNKLWVNELNNIIKAIDRGYEVPKTVESLTVDEEIKQDEKMISEWKSTGEELLFPLPSNEEQKEIARRLSQNFGVIVQGPPGTGKSHTIANLLCHLLAHGKRVLVTSQTNKALQVLVNKIPEDIRALCVSIIGEDAKSIKVLDESVRKITDNLSIDKGNLKKKLKREKDELEQCQKRQKLLYEKLKRAEIVENEKTEYNGKQISLMSMAKWVSENEKRFFWIEDEINFEAKLPIDDKQFSKLIYLLYKIKKEDVEKLKLIEDVIEELPKIEILSENIMQYKNLRDSYDYYKEITNGWKFNDNLEERYNELQAMLDSAEKEMERIEDSWLSKVKEYYFSSELIRPAWIQLLDKCETYFKKYNEINKELSTHNVYVSPEVDMEKLSEDFNTVYDYLEKHDKIGTFFKLLNHSKVYILDECKVNYKNIVSLEQAKIMKLFLQNYCIKRDIKNLWNNTVKEYGGEAVDVFDVNTYIKLKEDLRKIAVIINWNDIYRNNIERLLGNVKLPSAINFYIKDTYTYIKEGVNCYINIKKLKEKESYFKELESIFKSTAGGLDDLMSAVKNLNINDVKLCYKNIDRLNGIKDDINLIKDHISKLKDVVPLFASKLINYANSEEILNKYKNWEEAFKWKQWHCLLNNTHKIKLEDIEAELSKEKETEQKLIEVIVSNQTWYNQIEKTTESQKQSLYAWLEAVKRIGKGTGKYAPKYRRIAQNEMEKCKEAIPVWIMPLNKIIENLNITDNLFDVVIIDESSQSNIFALAALFRAKKAIIVGDDKQISPEAIGIHQSIIEDLIDKYLKDIPHAELFDLKASLYNTGLRAFPNKLMLKEHFRCAPEIIEFSNNLCYNGEIIPLRQQKSTEILEPVIAAVKVEDGYRDEIKKVNIPEAKAIVNKIIECCRDEKYKDMSMGVISLLGEAQAELIFDMLVEALGEQEVIERNLICGDAYSFQGDERDVMFLSMVIAGNTAYSALTKESDIQRFNVAASRARNQMWIFHSVDLNEINKNCVRAALLRYALKPEKNAEELNSDEIFFESELEKEIYTIIKELGYKVKAGVEAGKYKIDLVIEGADSKLAVECDGDKWHGVDDWEQRYERQAVLERVGWTFFKLRGSEFYRNKNKTIDGLVSKLKQMGIDTII